MGKRKIDFAGMDIIYQYIRNGNRQPVGMLVAYAYPNVLPDGYKFGSLYVGWSKCRLNGEFKDRFDKSIGMNIAVGRADKLMVYDSEEYIKNYNGKPENRQVDIGWDMERFIWRCRRYFSKRYDDITIPKFAQDDWNEATIQVKQPSHNHKHGVTYDGRYHNSNHEVLRKLIKTEFKTETLFAIASNLNITTVSRILNGHVKPHPSTVLAMSESLGVPINDLL